ncbi:Hypothetical protein GLP15_4950 [Giardia lamblia P15]|uniref:Uncharacterized protein n=1 Tax=Giardia intestinalis (strain P15) TaxID=658858 RepID=E1F0U5_GIAIA|nr:Hypothetical protein GLP15_4950 [Giardia lamblia P15]
MRSNFASQSISLKRGKRKDGPASKLSNPSVPIKHQSKRLGLLSKQTARNCALQQEEIALVNTYTYSTQTDTITDPQSNSTALTTMSADTTKAEKRGPSSATYKSLESVTSICSSTSESSEYSAANSSINSKNEDSASLNNLPPFRSMYCRWQYFYDQRLREIAKRYTVLPENHSIFNELIMNCKLEYSKSWRGQIAAYVSLLYLVGFVIIISICWLTGFYLYAKFIKSFEVCTMLPNSDYMFDAGKLLNIKKLPSPESISIVYGKFTGLGSVDVYHCTQRPGPITNLDGTIEHRPLSYLLSFSSAVTSVSFSLAGNGMPASVNLYANTLVSRHFPFSEKICILRTNNFEEPITDDNTPVLPLKFETCLTLQYILENRTTTDLRPIFYCDNTMGCNYELYLQTAHKYRDVLLDLYIVLDFADLNTRDCKYVGLTSTDSILPKPNNYLLIKRRNGSNLVRDTIVVTFHYTAKTFIIALIILLLIAIAVLALFVYTLQISQQRFYMRTINKVLNDYISNKKFRKEVMEAKSRL